MPKSLKIFELSTPCDRKYASLFFSFAILNCDFPYSNMGSVNGRNVIAS